MRSPFHLDESVIAANSGKVLALARARNFDLVPVLKSSFRSRKVIDALAATGIDTLGFSAPPPTSSFSGNVISLYPSPSQRNSVWPPNTVYAEVSDAPIGRLLSRLGSSATGPVEIMVPVLTSDGREGLESRDVLPFVAQLERQFGGSVHVRGLQACFGCVDDKPPTAKELRDLYDLTRSVSRQQSSQMVLSLGGSVLLPVLSEVPLSREVRVEIRCGEAILAGTVPGRGEMFGLRPTGRLTAEVVQKRAIDGKPLLLVDRGAFGISGAGTRPTIPGARIVQNTSQHTLVECPIGADVTNVSRVEFVLSYSDTVRCLGTRN